MSLRTFLSVLVFAAAQIPEFIHPSPAFFSCE